MSVSSRGTPESSQIIWLTESVGILNEANERLRQQNAELVEALKFYACDCQCLDGCSIADCGDVARKAIAKATGVSDG